MAASVLLIALTACGTSRNYAPVVEAGSHQKGGREYHVVSHGETLFSVAWRYGMDFKGLARANDIRAPYTIYPGQKLLLAERGAPAVSRTAKPAPPAHSSSGGDTKAASDNASRGASSAGSGSPPASSAIAAGSWQWPAQGTLSRRFRTSAPVHKGIDIKGKLGEPVLAANSGKVVYAGSGLVGYGNLVIVKHDDVYLSAYAHNRRLLVKEGEAVKAGAAIAEMGDSATDSVKLHFEIRRHGKPVDPMRMLPSRR